MTLNPPVQNAHSSFYYNGSLYIATDGGNGTAAAIHKINVHEKTSELVLNNYYGHRFAGFNDLAISPDGVIFASDTSTGYEHDILRRHLEIQVTRGYTSQRQERFEQ